MFLGAYVATVALVLVSYAFGVLDSQERAVVDLHFDLRGRLAPPRSIALVGIDAETFSRLRQTSSLSRSLQAKAIDVLRADGARVIAFDVLFETPTTVAEDNALIGSIARAGNVVLAAENVDERNRPFVLGGADVLDRIGARAGSSELAVNRGDVIRRVPYAIHGLESFSLVIAERARGHPIDRRAMGGDAAWIDFRGPAGTIPAIPFWKLVSGLVAPSAIRGRVVIIGATDPALQDLHSVSTGDLMPGVEVNANAVATALAGFALRDTPAGVDVLLILALGLLPLLTNLRFSPLRSLGLSGILAMAYALATQLAFDRLDRIAPFVYPVLALALASVAGLGLSYVAAAFERERVRDLFGRFVPEAVVDDLLLRTEGARLGGEMIEATVLFSDLRGFTSYSEGRSADEVIGVLNRYLSVMSDAILDRGGTLTAYLGDGIMALFGGPIGYADHADRALSAACAMLDRLEDFNRWLEQEGHGSGFRMGIGLATGHVMAGNVGSARRLEYTAIGDTVNLASRLEGLTKGTPHAMFVAESTYRKLTRRTTELVEVGELEVRGRMARARVWTLATLTADPTEREPDEAATGRG